MNEAEKIITKELKNTPQVIQGNDLKIPLHVLESISDCGCWQYDKVSRMITCSENLYSLLGINDQKINYTPEILLKMIPEQDQQQIKNQFKNAIRNRITDPFEFNIHSNKEGLKTFICSIFHHQHNVIKGILKDITITKKIKHVLEERTLLSEMLIENSVDIIAAFNNEFKLIAWNKKCEHFFGKSKAQVSGKSIFEIFPHFNEPEILHKMNKALKGDEIFSSENIFGYPEGYYETFILPLKANDGSIRGIFYMVHDVTEIKNNSIKLKQLNQTLQRRNEAYERSNEELASFSYVASHDLQEPLRKIQTFSQRILDKEQAQLSEGGKEYLKRMSSACERMQVLIDDLLTFSRTNSAPREYENVDMNKMLDEIIQELKENRDDTGAIINYKDLPVVQAVPFQFKQLFENLILNSIKYRKPGINPVINIDSVLETSTEDERLYHKITVTDNGIGFMQEYAEKIFELFQRLHGKHEYPGTGLGLAICKKIVENHKGKINATGKPGQGAIFTIYLPVQIET